jgi:GTP-binding protein
VGKSALFNRLCDKRIAIVDEAEGITRDRLYAEAEFFGRIFQVIDTGGIDPRTDIPYQEEIRRQAEIAMEEADVIAMVVDGTVGPTSLDEEIARLLLRRGKRVCLAVNKIDDRSHQDLIHEFYGLGISSIVGISALQGRQIIELLDEVFKGIVWQEEVVKEDAENIKIAIVGRPNVGKSTLLNAILGESRCVVSPVAGTTRDSVDVEITIEGQKYTLIDTAGIRRKKSEHEVVDKFAAIRTERALERADVCLLVLDAKEGLTAQEKRIAENIESLGKGCIVLMNKWDLVKGFRMEHCLRALQAKATFLNFCPTLFISALLGRNLGKLFTHIRHVHAELHKRITTGQLNRYIEKSIQKCHPPMLRGKRLRMYYMAQVDIAPPSFVLFVNKTELMTDTYKKYMVNELRKAYSFTGAPLLVSLRGKLGRERKEEAPIDEDEVTSQDQLTEMREVQTREFR